MEKELITNTRYFSYLSGVFSILTSMFRRLRYTISSGSLSMTERDTEAHSTRTENESMASLSGGDGARSAAAAVVAVVAVVGVMGAVAMVAGEAIVIGMPAENGAARALGWAAVGIP